MLDIRYIRENAERVKEFTVQKGYTADIGELLRLDERRRTLTGRADELRAERNASNPKGQPPTTEQIENGKRLKELIAAIEAELKSVDDDYLIILKKVPNIPESDVPVGASEDENIVAKIVGEPTKFDFDPKTHYAIGEARGWIDKERASKVAGARFAYIKGDMVKLQMAVVQFVIDTLTDEAKIKEIAHSAGLAVSTKPFTPVLPPLMIRTALYDAMDRLDPRDDRYKLEGDDLWLQGSAEHVLGSMHADEIFNENELPIRYLGYATSFRREAGTYGKDTEGILRMHQFDKLEMESFTTKEAGRSEHLLFVAIQQYLLNVLELPYRVIQKCTADIGKPNALGIDMETWMPGQQTYRETHTADYMTDYQARRLQTRVRREGGEVELVHTNDATAFALGRIMIAIIENFQTEDGHVTVPAVLRSYIGGRDLL
jgi:seryl-tRNA synthetase